MKKEYIEKAASETAERISNIAWSGGVQIGQSDLETAFLEGTEWRVNSIWHNVSEEPDEKKKVIALSRDDSMIECDFTYMHRLYTWEDIVNTSDITMWAYLEDLLPNMEE